MSLLKNLEKKLEKIIEGAFSKGFPSHVQPVEIAKKLDLELLENKTVTLARTFAPNHFKIELSEKDFSHLEGFLDSIKKELSDYLRSKSEKNNLYIEELEMEIVKNEALNLGQFKVSSQLTSTLEKEIKKEEVSQHTKIITPEEIAQSIKTVEHVIEEPTSKKIYKLIKPLTVVGRSKVCDISLADSGISRKHIQLEKENDKVRLVDLGSTNGTVVNDMRVKAKMLRNGDIIKIGSSALIYKRRQN